MHDRVRPNEATRALLSSTALLCRSCARHRRLTKDGRLDAASLCGNCLSEVTGFALDRAPTPQSGQPSDEEIDAVILSVLALDLLSDRGFEQAATRLFRAVPNDTAARAA